MWCMNMIIVLTIVRLDSYDYLQITCVVESQYRPMSVPILAYTGSADYFWHLFIQECPDINSTNSKTLVAPCWAYMCWFSLSFAQRHICSLLLPLHIASYHVTYLLWQHLFIAERWPDWLKYSLNHEMIYLKCMKWCLSNQAPCFAFKYKKSASNYLYAFMLVLLVVP